jgi:ribosomal subunit interface protein
MRIQIRERGVTLTKALRDQVERRLGLALGRFAGRIGVVVVRLSSDEGEKRCEIDVGLRPRKVRAEETHADLLAAVDRASNRLSSAVGRLLEQEVERVEIGRWAVPGGARALPHRRSKS